MNDKLLEHQKEIKAKNAEVAYLEAQLRRKDEENEKLKIENKKLSQQTRRSIHDSHKSSSGKYDTTEEMANKESESN